MLTVRHRRTGLATLVVLTPVFSPDTSVSRFELGRTLLNPNDELGDFLVGEEFFDRVVFPGKFGLGKNGVNLGMAGMVKLDGDAVHSAFQLGYQVVPTPMPDRNDSLA